MMDKNHIERVAPTEESFNLEDWVRTNRLDHCENLERIIRRIFVTHRDYIVGGRMNNGNLRLEIGDKRGFLDRLVDRAYQVDYKIYGCKTYEEAVNLRCEIYREIDKYMRSVGL
jgi:hypothetical protein